MESVFSKLYFAQAVLQRLSVVVIGFGAGAAVLMTVGGALGFWPMISLSVGFGDTVFDAGAWAQWIGTALLVALAGYLPANGRIMALETSHRKFHMGMEDVARAYAMAHAEDRGGAFVTASEFDAVRERLHFLSKHPDLETLEPEVLEIAAQMSTISKELADVYSEERLARARGFLLSRQQEVDRFNRNLDRAKVVVQELRQWQARVEMDEAMAASQLERLQDELRDLIPERGTERVFDPAKLLSLPRVAE